MKKYIFAFAVLSIVFLLVIVPLIARIIEATEYYKIGQNMVPSINSIVGERKLSEWTSSLIPMKKTYEYTRVEDPKADIEKYYEYLIYNEGFIPINDGDGEKTVAKESSKEGYIIVIDISIMGQGYLVTLVEGKGIIQ